MKKIKRVGFLFCLVATMFWLLPVIGCQHSSGGGDWSDDPPEEEEPEKNILNENPSVVSRWVNSGGDYEEILTFYDDGTYTYEKYENDELTEGQKGIYSGDISSGEETKLTATEDYSEGKWGSASSCGFYVKITGDSIEVVVWWTEEDGTENRGESSSFSSETENDDGDYEENLNEDNEGGFSNENPDDSDPETDNNGEDDDTGGTGNSGNTGSEDGENTSDENENEESCFTVAKAAEYIASLTEAGTYYVKVVDGTETSCSALKTALISVNNKGIYIELDLSETIVSVEEQNVFGCSYSYSDSKLSYSLLSIIFPNNCTSIGPYSFTGCSNLKSITIPSSVSSIGKWAFGDCSSLTSAVFEDPSGWIVTTAQGYVSIDTNVLNSPSTAAQYLTKTYYSTNWNKE